MSLFDKYKARGRTERDDGLYDIDGVWPCPECEAVGEGKYNNEKGVVVRICDEHPDAEIFIGSGRA